MAEQVGGGGAAVRRHRFFKILYPGSFESRLFLPPKFAAGLRWSRGSATATLRDPAGRPWDVELSRHYSDDGDDVVRLCFAGSGWSRFVAGNGISGGHLLVFDHLGGLEFAVELFEASGCVRDVDDGTRTTGPAVNNNSTASPDMESGVSHCNDWSYAGTKRKWSPPADTSAAAGSRERSEDDDDTSTLRRRIQRPYQLRYLDLSKSFCGRMGWTSSRTAQVTVAGSERRWEVTVKVGKKGGMITRGWTEFAQDSGVRVSDTCVFLRPRTTGNQLVQVQVLSG